MTTLASITLPDDTLWIDEWEHTPIDQNIRFTLGGRQVINTRARVKGRNITLDCHWLEKSVVDALVALRDSDAVMQLTLPDARVFTVKFRHNDPPPIDAIPVIDYDELLDTDNVSVKLRLIEV